MKEMTRKFQIKRRNARDQRRTETVKIPFYREILVAFLLTNLNLDSAIENSIFRSI